MANRFVLKQFAGSATNNGAFGAAQATGAGVQPVANIEDVQSLAAFEQGWNSATLTADKLPALEEMQGLEAILCKAIKENYSEGIPLWINGETYYQYSFVNYNGVIYYNTTGSYTANNPATDTTNWAQYKPATAGAADTAAVADKLGLSTVGSATQGIYLNNGVPTPMTTGFANQDLSNLSVTGEDHFVTKNTTQTISGAKTFSSILNVDNNFTGSGHSPAIKFSSNGTALGYLYNYAANNEYAFSDSSYQLSTLRVKTQATTDNSDKVATTQWVNATNKTGRGIGAPNYGGATSFNLTSSTPFTATENGWIQGETRNDIAPYSILIDGCVVAQGALAGGYYAYKQGYCVPIAKGSVVTTNTTTSLSLNFIPCK